MATRVALAESGEEFDGENYEELYVTHCDDGSGDESGEEFTDGNLERSSAAHRGIEKLVSVLWISYNILQLSRDMQALDLLMFSASIVRLGCGKRSGSINLLLMVPQFSEFVVPRNHHLFGSLIPKIGEDPRFCQLYIYDRKNEIENRLRWVNVAGGGEVDAEIVQYLLVMLDDTNELVKEFHSARDRYGEHGAVDLEIRLKVSRSESGRENHVGPSDEVVGIMVGDMDEIDGSRDIIIHSHLHVVTLIHPIWVKDLFFLPDLWDHGVMYVVEFQKRGLPQVHMLIWLDPASKHDLQENVDKYVSAKIPNPDVDPVGYAAMTEFMMHGPCGKDWSKSLCLKEYKCMRYCVSTKFDQSEFPIYRRKEIKISMKMGRAVLENQWVVPYNRDLLVRYQCHINVEICAHAHSLKYLFKYFLEGHDRATVEIRGRKRKLASGQGMDEFEDEIQSYFDGRYICGCEAAYRVFGFNIDYRSLAVERLSFHLEGRKPCTFFANEPLPKVATREREKHSQLEAYFTLNATDSNVVRGATSFESLRSVKGKVGSTYQEVYRDFGLLDDDNELYQVSDLNGLWNNHWINMVDDLVKKQREITGNPHLILNEKQQQFDALVETSYNIAEMEKEFLALYSYCNAEQLEVYNAVMQSVDNREGDVICVW
ncbi:uncharacterized protein LOC141697289 [Apium graveolens]|uniref:uncharacterized protein LOC141697289 n=1 Tax=Apium graveolens TaxID=4045 RepID=UPI003D7BE906